MPHSTVGWSTPMAELDALRAKVRHQLTSGDFLFPALMHDCPDCGQPMTRYGLHWRCECGRTEEA